MKALKLLPCWLLFIFGCCTYSFLYAQEEERAIVTYLNNWTDLSVKISSYQQELHTYYKNYSIHWHARLYQEKMKGGLTVWAHDSALWEDWAQNLANLEAPTAYLQLQQKCLEKAQGISLSLAKQTTSRTYLKDPHLYEIRKLMDQWDGILLDVQESTRQQWPQQRSSSHSRPDAVDRLVKGCMRSCENLLYAIASSYQTDVDKEEQQLISQLIGLEKEETSSKSMQLFQELVKEFLNQVNAYQTASAAEERYKGESKSQYFMQTYFLPLFSQDGVNIQQLYRELMEAGESSALILPFVPVPEISFPPLKESSEAVRFPAHWIWLVDASESMKEGERWNSIQQWIEESLSSLSEKDRVSLMTYQEKPALLLERVNPQIVDSENLWTEVQPGQKGHLPLALNQAMKVGGKQEGLPTQILLCTDGGFEINEAMVKQVEKIQLSGLKLSILLTDSLTYEREQALQKIARIGGGNLILLSKE